MFRRIQSLLTKCVHNKGLVCQCLQGSAGFGNQNKDGMRYICGSEHRRRVIRIHVADKLRLHTEVSCLFRPVFQRQIHGSRSQIASADTNLHHRRKFIPGSVCNFSLMHLVREFRNTLLLLFVESALVHTVRDDRFSQLASGQMMENQPFFSGIDDSTVIQFFKFLRQLRLCGKLLQLFRNSVVHCLGCIIIGKSFRHGNTAVLHTVRAALPGHNRFQIHRRYLLQLLISSQLIQIFPVCHLRFPP